MGRPIGRRIKQVSEIVEKFGPCSAAQVHKHMQEVNIENVHKYCSRAVGLRLLDVDRSGFPKVFRIVDKSVISPIIAGPEPEKPPEVHYLHGIWR
jgi:hypothetical protein